MNLFIPITEWWALPMIHLVLSTLIPYKQGYGMEIENWKQKRWKLVSNDCIVLAQIMTIFSEIHTRILFLGER